MAQPPADGVLLRDWPEDPSGWPDDPDEVPPWVLRAEMWREQAGITPVRCPVRTKREVWQQQDLCEMAVAAALTPPLVELAPALPTAEAARRFLEAIRDDELVREFTAAELADEYHQWCERQALTPSAVDQVKAELALMAGVHKRREDRRVPETGKRARNWIWIVVPHCEMEHHGSAVEIAEHEELRRAA